MWHLSPTEARYVLSSIPIGSRTSATPIAYIEPFLAFTQQSGGPFWDNRVPHLLQIYVDTRYRQIGGDIELSQVQEWPRCKKSRSKGKVLYLLPACLHVQHHRSKRGPATTAGLGRAAEALRACDLLLLGFERHGHDAGVLWPGQELE